MSDPDQDKADAQIEPAKPPRPEAGPEGGPEGASEAGPSGGPEFTDADDERPPSPQGDVNPGTETA